MGLNHVAMGAADKGRLRKLWVELLGAELVGEHSSPAENVVEDLALLGSEQTRFELNLMQPFTPGGTPRVETPALHHIALWVDDLRAAHSWLSAQGVRFTPGGIRPGASGHDVCFIHPKPSAEAAFSGEGVLIELVQAPSG